MQRRAAAAYFVILVVVGAGALGFVQVGMSAPEVSIDGPAYTEGDTLTVGDRTYEVTSVDTETTGGDHGEPEETVFVGEIQWTDESARMTATLDNDSTVTYQGGEYRLLVDGSDGFELVEVRNVSAVLAADPAVENETLTRDGEAFVRYRNGTTRPLSAYLPTPERLAFGVGDDYAYDTGEGAVTATVDSVSAAEVTLAWTASETTTIELDEGGNLTLGADGQPYFVHFVDDETVQILPTDQYYDSYQQQLDEIDYFEERRNGVWGVVILTFLVGLVLVTAAFMPVK